MDWVLSSSVRCVHSPIPSTQYSLSSTYFASRAFNSAAVGTGRLQARLRQT